MRFLYWFRRRPKFNINDIVVAKTDPYMFPMSAAVYMKVLKIEKETITVKHPGVNVGVIFYNPDDLVKVQLSDLEKIVYDI